MIVKTRLVIGFASRLYNIRDRGPFTAVIVNVTAAGASESPHHSRFRMLRDKTGTSSRNDAMTRASVSIRSTNSNGPSCGTVRKASKMPAERRPNNGLPGPR
jgi:hypothetical protein